MHKNTICLWYNHKPKKLRVFILIYSPIVIWAQFTARQVITPMVRLGRY